MGLAWRLRFSLISVSASENMMHPPHQPIERYVFIEYLFMSGVRHGKAGELPGW